MPPTTVRIPAWADPQNASVLDSWWQKAARTLGDIMGAADPTSQAMALGAPVEVPNGGSVPIRAYHGSPHDFDAFSLSKIGTGEGAQAYGHGLYFAEKESTAEAYRHALSDFAVELPDKRLGGRFVPTYTKEGPEDMALAWVQDAAHGGAVDPFETAAINARKAGHALGRRELYEQAAQHIEDWKAAGGRVTRGGKTYEVNIHASPDELLDWDKPLSQQPQIMKRLQSVDMADATHVFTPEGAKPADETTGEDVYRAFSSTRGANVASRLGRRAGIKGIQYLDQGSRAAGEGTRNFVIFDDKIIDIAKKYGVSLPVAAKLYADQQSKSPRAVNPTPYQLSR